ncbi:MAG: lysophospholipase [Pseudomonadota bacterium]
MQTPTSIEQEVASQEGPESNLPVEPVVPMEVSCEEHTLGSGVFYRHWRAPSPKGVVLLAHGLGEHSGRYQHVAAALGHAGFSCVAPDHMGHGRSPGNRCFVTAFTDFYEPLDALRSQIDELYEGLPCFLIGHSMGGLIASTYLLQRQNSFAGAAFSGAAFRVPEPPSGILLLIAKLLSVLMPRAGLMQLDASEVSRDPQVVADYVADPLVHSGKISARLVTELFGAIDQHVRRSGEIKVPVLIMHGAGDVMTAVEGSREFHGAVSSTDKTLKIYPDLYHEIFNEPERDQVLADLCEWLDDRVGRVASHSAS